MLDCGFGFWGLLLVVTGFDGGLRLFVIGKCTGLLLVCVLLLCLVRVFLLMVVGFCYLVWVLLFGSLLYSRVCYGLLG